MAEKHVCMPENVEMFRKWLAERGGLAIWESVDLCDGGRTWTAPVNQADGTPAGPPHWKCGPHSKPIRIITDPAEVVVEVPKVLEEFEVSLKVSGNMAVLTSWSEKKVFKRVKHWEAEYPGKSVWFVTGDLMFPSATILVAEKTVPLMEYHTVPV